MESPGRYLITVSRATRKALYTIQVGKLAGSVSVCAMCSAQAPDLSTDYADKVAVGPSHQNMQQVLSTCVQHPEVKVWLVIQHNIVWWTALRCRC